MERGPFHAVSAPLGPAPCVPQTEGPEQGDVLPQLHSGLFHPVSGRLWDAQGRAVRQALKSHSTLSWASSPHSELSGILLPAQAHNACPPAIIPPTWCGERARPGRAHFTLDPQSRPVFPLANTSWNPDLPGCIGPTTN